MNQFFDVVKELMVKMESQKENVEKAAQLTAQALMNGGIIQAFGSGHSIGCAMEMATRAGGFIPSKLLQVQNIGDFEAIEGVGTQFMTKVDLRENDILFAVSNSGRNPLGIEIALAAQARGAKVVVVTSLEASKKLSSKHSSGKNLYQVADVVIDNCAPDGDAAIMVPGMDTAVCGVSAVTSNMLLQSVTLRTVEIMVEKGQVPPVFKSQNIDGGPEYNKALTDKFFDRLYHK